MSTLHSEVARRSVVRGAVWAAPAIVVASAVPAYASTSNPPVDVTGVVDWDSGTYAYSSHLAASYVVPAVVPVELGTVGAEPLTLDIVHAPGTNTKTGTQAGTPGGANDLNLRLSPGGVGGTGGGLGLTLHQAPVDNNLVQYEPLARNRSTTTFTFSRPVKDLVFTVCGINGADNDFIDGVSLVGAEFRDDIEDPKVFMLGVGIPLEEVFCADETALVAFDPIAASVRFTSLQEVTSFSLGYWHMLPTQTPVGDRDQQVYLSDFSFTYPSH